MGKMERNLGEQWKNSVVYLTTIKEDDNLALEWRGALIKLIEIIQIIFTNLENCQYVMYYYKIIQSFTFLLSS